MCGAGGVAVGDDAEPGADLGQFVVEEVARRGAAGPRGGGSRLPRAAIASATSSQIQASTMWPKACMYGTALASASPGSPVAQAALVAAPTCCSALPSALAYSARSRPLDRAFDRAVDATGQQLQAPAAFHQHLAAQQVGRLDAVRALVDHVQAVVAPVLLHREVARVAVAAMDLDRQRIGFQAPLAGPALGDRRQHFQQQAGLVGGLRAAPVCCSSTSRAQYSSSASAPSQ